MSSPTPTALAADRLGVPAVVFFVMSAATPLTVVAGVITLAYAVTGLLGLPLAFLLVGLLLAGFGVGYVAMSRQVANAGAFYAYVSRGLGRPAGVGTDPAGGGQPVSGGGAAGPASGGGSQDGGDQGGGDQGGGDEDADPPADPPAPLAIDATVDTVTPGGQCFAAGTISVSGGSYPLTVHYQWRRLVVAGGFEGEPVSAVHNVSFDQPGSVSVQTNALPEDGTNVMLIVTGPEQTGSGAVGYDGCSDGPGGIAPPGS